MIGTAIGAFVFVAAVIATAGWMFSPALLKLLATPAGAAPLALAYLRVIFIAMPAILILVLLMMGMRGAGDAMTPLWAMLVAVVLNSTLNPVFIRGLGPAPRLGIAGSATATVIANYSALIGLVVYMYARAFAAAPQGPRVALPDPRSGDPQDHRGEGQFRWACR